MKKIETDDFVVIYTDDDDTRNKVFDKIIKFFVSYQAFNGESIHQSDDIPVEACCLLSDLAENVLKFDVKFKD